MEIFYYCFKELHIRTVEFHFWDDLNLLASLIRLRSPATRFNWENVSHFKMLPSAQNLRCGFELNHVYWTYIWIKTKYYYISFTENLNMALTAVSGWVKIRALIWRQAGEEQICDWPLILPCFICIREYKLKRLNSSMSQAKN